MRTTGLATAGLLVALAALGLANGSGRATASPTAGAAPERAYGNLPLAFEPNRGQAAPTTDFLVRGAGYSIALRATKALFGLGEGERLSMELKGANERARLDPEQRLPGTVNYLRGNERSKWRTGIPTYARLRANDVYPGIDLAYYGKQGRLEYDLLVHPGASPKVISLRFVGARKLRLDRRGNLVFQLGGGGALRQLAPRVYQQVGGQRHHVAGRFTLRGKRVGFALGHYDRTRTLVIDPVLVYSTYLGGSDFDDGFGIAVDSGGSAYLTGVTYSLDFPTMPASPLQAANAGGADAFVAKLDAAGTSLVYSTYLGGSGYDDGHAIAVDAGGSAYVTGATGSTDFPTARALQPTNADGGTSYEAFVAKLNPVGAALVYSTYLGGSGFDIGGAIAVDAGGSAYLTGFTDSLNFPTAPAIPLQVVNAGGGDAFVTKLDAAGTVLVYSTYLGGSGGEQGFGIDVDAGGSAYLTGYTDSLNFPIPLVVPPVIPLQVANAGGADAFVAKLDAAGTSLVYSTYLGGSGYDDGRGIAVDAAGSAYLTGHTDSTNFPTAPASPLQATNAGGDYDAFVAKLNAAGTALAYSTYLGGSGSDDGFGIAVDAGGSASLTGLTGSTDFPTASPPQGAKAGGADAFVAKLDAAGTELVYSTYLGGDGYEISLGIALDAGGSAYLIGATNSTNFPSAPVGPLQAENAGDFDAFVSKIGGTATTVRLLSFTARPSARGVVLRWRTAAGARLLGVNVYRGNKRLNRRLLGASGGFLDRSARRGMTSTYRLQAVAPDGTRLWLATATPA